MALIEIFSRRETKILVFIAIVACGIAAVKSFFSLDLLLESPLLKAMVLQTLRFFLSLTFTAGPQDFDSDLPATGAYDFIVVGAGAAGCVVASRLSETSARVLLLEEGKSATLESAIPRLAFIQPVSDNVRWIKSFSRENTLLGVKNQTIPMIVPRVMGGGTTVNLALYVRGAKLDYDNWSALGNPGWDHASLLPYFRKSEDFIGTITEHTDEYHGKGGPLTVDTTDDVRKMEEIIRPVAAELGLDIIDPNGPSNIGLAPVHNTVKKGVRASSSEAFLKPVFNRKNLHILPGARVDKILFNQENEAVGVEYTFRGKTYKVEARKEVIISAGTLHTPKLLMLSGIGPRKQIEELGIPVVAEVPGVGQNLDSHQLFALNFKIKPGLSPTFMDLMNPFHIASYLREQTGFYSLPITPLMHTYLNLGGGDPHRPDVDIFMTPMVGVGLPVYTNEIKSQLFGPLLNEPVLNVGVMLCRPKSKGYVAITSADPADFPFINHNFYDHPDDVKLHVKGVKELNRIMSSEGMRKILAPQPDLTLKACAHLGNKTDGYWECYARHMALPNEHFCCTAKMAPPTDPMGVVSPRLSVRGVSGLRVVDASVMPEVVSTNTMATVYVIAEKASDIIKQDWSLENTKTASK
ncbi:glucose dehydrogenase [FAD, quinone] [Hyalella azteca]|uniref:Glucose dehydrogenase [FAD, quinone] n=1 Tax=Hyalella azteca TaxID=294128 RepID=A0A8B7NJW2_HYAAZ|nr:glucose dehydrogenase [FAD, quinone] [Hyalella azteca]